MIGRAISHYRVLSALGSGGMGVVYLAEDERLGRHVALKFLPPDSARNRQALDRFRVEARAASSLSHPGICAIYDIGEDEGTPFIVMEALRGETLRDRINRGPIKVADLLEIGIQLADALEAAHSQGIIHRDIKPSNIFVGDKNRAKILDFGLAKLSTGSTPPDGRTVDSSTHPTIVKQITIPGSALGTVSYMSPEQARGEDVDTRTDLFSLGAVLYEMATGTQAFGGSTPAVVFDQILNHTPPVLADLNPMVPPRLEAIITMLLEKDRDLRYQHASDLQAELKRLRRDLDSGTLMGVSASRTGASTSTAPRSASKVGPPPAPEPVPVRSWRYGIAALALLVVAAVVFTIWSGRSTGTSSANDRAVITGPSAPVAPTTVPTPAPAPQEPAPAVPPVTAATPPPARPPTGAPAPTQTAPKSAPTAPPIEPRAAGTAARGTPTPLPPPQKEPTPTPPVQTAQTAPPPAPPPTPTTTPVTPAPAAVETPPAPIASPPPQAQPAAPRAAEPAPTQSAARASEAPAPAVESDDAAIRRVIATYKTAIETKNVTLFRSVRPGLSAAEESRLRDSFRQVDSQQVTIAVDEIRVDGRMATARISRQDVITSAGRRQTQSVRQTLRFEKSATGWIITSIGG